LLFEARVSLPLALGAGALPGSCAETEAPCAAALPSWLWSPDRGLVRDHLLVGVEGLRFLAAAVAVDAGGDFGADLAGADDRLDQAFDLRA
jgi:hypothetical protein